MAGTLNLVIKIPFIDANRTPTIIAAGIKTKKLKPFWDK
ncbi:protein of unknown function [[Clostridium] ultunense Esp]|uniref:Uncharacterized protein n=1 Tax=[Clostridium] ultunense Esp TaxID=1288971 RepID=A0A1M4PLL0_9FIRM|nr:protein of unknown function [[Clostridium] ultunense Esp]